VAPAATEKIEPVNAIKPAAANVNSVCQESCGMQNLKFLNCCHPQIREVAERESYSLRYTNNS
jgi:hypothetical protein